MKKMVVQNDRRIKLITTRIILLVLMIIFVSVDSKAQKINGNSKISGQTILKTPLLQ